MLAGEERNIAHAVAKTSTGTLLLSRIGIVVLSALGLLALFMYQRQTNCAQAAADCSSSAWCRPSVTGSRSR